MKNLSFIISGLTFMLISNLLSAQTEEKTNQRDTTRVKISNVEILVIADSDYKNQEGFEFSDSLDLKCKEKDDRNKHWAGLGIGTNGWINSEGGIGAGPNYEHLELNQSKSIHFAWNFIEKDIRLVKEYVKIVTGMGAEWTSYSFKKNYTLLPQQDTVISFLDTTINFNKNKLKSTYINIPLMLAFNTSSDPEKSFRISVGVIGGYNIGSKLKQQYFINDDKFKPVVKSDFNVNPIKYGLHCGVGYGNFNLYGSYALSTMFESDKAPELYPFNVGIRMFVD